MDIIKLITNDILSEPAMLVGLMALIGLLALKKPVGKILTGTLKPILGFLMLGVGAGTIVAALDPLGQMIQHGFHITGVVPNNEAVVSVAQKLLGKETMLIMALGFLLNIVIARSTRFKYIFLTGHHSFFMACLLSAVLGAAGFKGMELVLLGGFFLAAVSAMMPAIGQQYTLKVTNGDEVAMGHFGSLGYYLSAWVGKFAGKPEDSTENIKVADEWSFLRDTTVSTAVTMVIFYGVIALVAGADFVGQLAGGKNFLFYAIMEGLRFAVGVNIVYAGVRMILADLVPAFQGVATKIVPNAVPAVDCAVFFTYAPTAVIIGFVSSFIGGIVGMLILGSMGAVLIIPGLVPHFFCGASAGIYGNATGGRRGAMLGAFVNGLGITFLPALLLPVLGQLGFANTTFGDFDFGVIGIVIGKAASWLGNGGVYGLAILLLLILILPSFTKGENVAINNQQFKA